MSQIIRPSRHPNEFDIYWQGVQGSKIHLDFNPLLESYQLEGEYCLLHWQARPRGLRRWGIYDSATGTYTALDAPQLLDSPIRLLQVPEPLQPGGSVPTAVCCIQGALSRDGDNYRIDG